MMLGIGFLMMFLIMGLLILLVALFIIFIFRGFQRLIPSTVNQPVTLGEAVGQISSDKQQDAFSRYCFHCGAGLKPDWSDCPQCGAGR